MDGIFRTSTAAAPQTAKPLSSKVTRRSTTTATGKIAPSGHVVNISGYSTVNGLVNSGGSPLATGLRRNRKNIAVSGNVNFDTNVVPGTPAYRSNRGLFR